MKKDYDVYSNNCQNFVRYLHKILCQLSEGSQAPRTFQETVEDLINLIRFRPVGRPTIPKEGLEVVSRRDLLSISFSRIHSYIVAALITLGHGRTNIIRTVRISEWGIRLDRVYVATLIGTCAFFF